MADYVLNNMKKRKQGFHTAAAKKIAEQSYRFVENFFQTLKEKTLNH